MIRRNQIKHWHHMEKQPFSSALWKHEANCVWQIESIFAMPFAKLVQHLFPCLFLLSPYRGHLILTFPACLANTKEGVTFIGPGLFVFRLFPHYMSGFMSSLRRNIKEAHSLLILTMTIQSFRHTDFTVWACTLLKIRLQSLFFKHRLLLVFIKFCPIQAFHCIKQNKQVSRITVDKELRWVFPTGRKW